MVSVEQVLALAQIKGRVCPQPQRWHELWEMLPDKRQKGASWEPALPLILAAWWDTPALLKILRMRAHIEWAAAHGCLDEVHSFLSELSEDQWHHFGD